MITPRGGDEALSHAFGPGDQLVLPALNGASVDQPEHSGLVQSLGVEKSNSSMLVS